MDKLIEFSNSFFGIIISLLVVIFSIYVTISKAYPHYRKHIYFSQNGIKITGIVIRTNRKAMVDSSWDVIDVQYEIEGKTYTYTFDGDERFRVGDKISLFVDPYNYKDASLQDGRWYRNSIIVGLIFSGIFFLCFIFFLWEYFNQ